MDFNTLTVNFLHIMKNLTGSWGLAIISVTVIVRAILWPLSVSQQRSMKQMQVLGPKMKEIQNRYKSDPEKMQKKMMEFYKEHKFNPFGGCFPLLLQMPVFILLYAALSSPQFIQVAGNSSFLFVKRLDAPLKSHSKTIDSKSLGVSKYDKFSMSDDAKITFADNTIKIVKIKDAKKALKTQEDKIIPGKPVGFKIDAYDLELTLAEVDKVKKAEITVINTNTKELKPIIFEKKGSYLLAQINTEPVKSIYHPDVFFLILLFGISMFFSQKIMTAQNKNMATDASQQAMQQSMANMMPIMITMMFIFFPVPAGVLLYMIVSNIFQVVQTIVINNQIDKEDAKKKNGIVDSAIGDAKKIEPKKIEDKTDNQNA